MGGGNTKHYVLAFREPTNNCLKVTMKSVDPSQPSATEPMDEADRIIEQVKKPIIKRTNSHPDMLSQSTIFCPYIDMRVGKKNESTNVVQRKVVRVKHSLIGNGQLDYKKSDYFEFTTRLPWLLKNAFFVAPNIRDFTTIRVIGAGRTSKVTLMKTDRDKYFVVKAIKKAFIFKNEDQRHVIGERESLYEVNHPFCVKLLAEFEDQTYAYFALEYVAGGELRSLLSSNKRLTVDTAKFYAAEILAALDHIHNAKIVYRDLRPENILIDEEGHLKLVDFGFAMRSSYNANGKHYTICCPAAYLSPELLNSKFEGGYGKEVDVWAFGVMLFELMVGYTPFCRIGEESQYEIFLAILQNKINFPTFFDQSARDLLRQVLNAELEHRMVEVDAVKTQPFFTSQISDWDAVNKRLLVPPFVPTLECEGDSRYFAVTEGSAKHFKRLKGLENKLQLS